MKKIIFILSVFAFIASGCGEKTNKTADTTPQNNSSRENIPFHYNESETVFSGAFAVSPDYFAELTLTAETKELIVLINGKETPFDFAISENLEELFFFGLCVRTEDFNSDGYVDFEWIPNCSARFPESYVYLFDKDKECFTAYKDDEDESEESPFLLLENTIGFMRASYENLDTLQRIEFLNDDGSVWFSFHADILEYHENVERGVNADNEDFEPWAFGPEIGVFVIRCIAKLEAGYTVIVNEKTNTVKQLKKHNNIQFQTVEEHVLGAIIGNDFNVNPIRENPNDNAKVVYATDEEIEVLTAVEMKGEWIKIEDIYSNKILGWIRWKMDGRLMIQMYYSI